MAENIERSHGLIFSQRVLLRLTEAGLPRQEAYEIVQKNAMRAWKERRSLPRAPRRRCRGDGSSLARRAHGCFDPAWYLRNVDAIFAA